VQFLAVKPVVGAEAIDLLLNTSLLGLEPRELGLSLRERTQIPGNEGTHGAALLGRADSCGAINIVGDGNCYISHCEAQYHRYTGTATQPPKSTAPENVYAPENSDALSGFTSGSPA